MCGGRPATQGLTRWTGEGDHFAPWPRLRTTSRPVRKTVSLPNLQRVTREELRDIDHGTLYITNKRLLFNGAAKNLNVPYKKIVQFTVYTDGLLIEKDAGRDQYFIGEGDMEVLGAILETCIRISRES